MPAAFNRYGDVNGKAYMKSNAWMLAIFQVTAIKKFINNEFTIKKTLLVKEMARI
jgi:hypothetical protein